MKRPHRTTTHRTGRASMMLVVVLFATVLTTAFAADGRTSHAADPVAFARSSGSEKVRELTDEPVVVDKVVVDAPASGNVLLTSIATIVAWGPNGQGVHCSLQHPENAANLSEPWAEPDHQWFKKWNAVDEGTLNGNRVYPVTPGTQTFYLVCRVSKASAAYGGEVVTSTINALYVPEGDPGQRSLHQASTTTKQTVAADGSAAASLSIPATGNDRILVWATAAVEIGSAGAVHCGLSTNGSLSSDPRDHSSLDYLPDPDMARSSGSLHLFTARGVAPGTYTFQLVCGSDPYGLVTPSKLSVYRASISALVVPKQLSDSVVEYRHEQISDGSRRTALHGTAPFGGGAAMVYSGTRVGFQRDTHSPDVPFGMRCWILNGGGYDTWASKQLLEHHFTETYKWKPGIFKKAYYEQWGDDQLFGSKYYGYTDQGGFHKDLYCSEPTGMRRLNTKTTVVAIYLQPPQ